MASAAHGLIDFLNKAPTPFHAVEEGVKRLVKEGFVRLKEKEIWTSNVLQPGGKYFVTRNQSSLIAFTLPQTYQTGNGFAIVGTHTDSPCFKVRPVSKVLKQGYHGIAVEKYGGGLWHSHLDRDLGLAGRVIVKNQNNQYESRLVHLNKALIRIPAVAIHLDRTQNDKTSYNTETQMFPMLGLVEEALNKNSSQETSTPDDAGQLNSAKDKHDSLVVSLLAEAAGVSPNDIFDFTLQLCDAQPSAIGGAKDDFVFSGRLDNLFSTYCAIEAICSSNSVSDKGTMIACWDNEEVGSVSAYGAESNFLESVLHRLSAIENTESSRSHVTIANSFLVSCDMAHGIHPGFENLYQTNNTPKINGGPAIKFNANQRYATSANTSFLLKRVASEAKVPVQVYEIRNDMTCGSTIGPLVSKIGLRTVDIGCPMLSMHSIRETAGTKDVGFLIELFRKFFEQFGPLDDVTPNGNGLLID